MSQLPVKIIPSELYSLVLEYNGITYFWCLDGKFDGWDMRADTVLQQQEKST